MVSRFAILGLLELGVSQLLWGACVGFRCSGLACGCFVGFRAWRAQAYQLQELFTV